MKTKLLRRPLPPCISKSEGHSSPISDQPDLISSHTTNQYLPMNSKDDMPHKPVSLLNNSKSITPLLQNPPPSMQFLSDSKSFTDVAHWVYNVSKAKSNISSSKEHLKALSLFPLRPPRKLASQGTMLSRLYKEGAKLSAPLNSGINEFITKVSKLSQVPETVAERIMYSKNTYQKIADLVAEKYLRQSSRSTLLHVLDIPLEMLGEIPKRVPQKQLLLELSALIKDHLKEKMNIDVHTMIQPLPRFHFGCKNKPETEIILYQQTTSPENLLNDVMQRDSDNALQEKQDNYFTEKDPKYFHGGKRVQTPFNLSSENVSSQSEIAILNTILTGENELNFKAHFVSTLPDISFLRDQLTSLNISFNNFSVLPASILLLENLEVLKARDNPLAELPTDISKLKNLKTLIISFCLLSSFPPQFFELTKLQHLDLSFNKLEHLPSQISQLSSLVELGLEGNQLHILPATILALDLHFLGLKNNFMHHLFWQTTKEFYAENKIVKSLEELAAVVVYNEMIDNENYEKPEGIMERLESMLLIHCYGCNRAIGANGLCDVKIHRNIFGHTALLLLYEACSVACMEALR